MINWQQEKSIKNTIHLHGTNDEIFPFKNIKNCLSIQGANHSMIILRAKEIANIIQQILIS